ncbi:hypothetical protein LCGC14_3029050, partial [marine sediment metagenome]
MLMLTGATSAKRLMDSLLVRLAVQPVGVPTSTTQGMHALRPDVMTVRHGTGLVRSAVLLTMLLLPTSASATDWTKNFLPPVRNGLGPIRIGCTIRGPSLQFTGRTVVCGHRFTERGLVALICPREHKAWDVHLWADYLVYKTTSSGLRYVISRTTWKRWYSRRWSRKAAYKDCRRFGRAWKNHLRH